MMQLDAIKYGIRKAIMPSLNLRNAMIKDSVVDANEQLLSTGVWGLVTLRYSEPLRDERGRDLTLRVMIGDFKPFHVSNTDLKGFIKKRQISLSMNGLTC